MNANDAKEISDGKDIYDKAV